MASESDSDDNSDPPVPKIFVANDAGIFSFDGYQLEFQDHPYAKNVAQYIPLLEPEPPRANNGTIAARQPRHDSKPRSWWQSQCAFRGLPSDGNIEEMQNALRGHEEDCISGDILDLLDMAKKKFKTRNREARESNWVHNMSDEEKATKNPRRYLEETFPAGSKSMETVLLTTHFVASIRETARELGLQCEYTHAPADGDAVLRMAKYWVVIGQDRATVIEKVRMIERETQRLKREQEEGQQELRRKNKVMRRKHMETEEAKAKSKDWDVTGSWRISCPHIEESWDVESLTMKIFVEITEKGAQMFAEFDFGVLTGVLRFERQEGDTITSSTRPMKSNDNDEEEKTEEEDEISEKSSDTYAENEEDDDDDDEAEDRRIPTPETFYFKSITQPSAKHPTWNCRYRGEESGEGVIEDDDDDDEAEDRRSPTPETFYFKSITQPSAKHPTWNYRYRGEESGEGVIELGSDLELYCLTFCGPSGRVLKGTIGGSVFGDCTFTGFRVGDVGTEYLDIREEWANRNASAYENSRVDRWH